MRRTGSGKDRPKPPPVPDADGFIPITALPRRVQKETPSSQNKNYLAKGQRIQTNHHEPAHSYSSLAETGSAISRVQRGPNNVTYISIGMDSDSVAQNQRLPTPPPDYNESDNEPSKLLQTNSRRRGQSENHDGEYPVRHVYEPQPTFIRKL